MACTIPGCGSSGHNRRTHDKHVPPGEAIDLLGSLQAAVDRAKAGRTVLDRDQHECEPAPDQVYYCLHCGGDLMVPLAGEPEPVTGSGLDEFAPEVVEAVSRIGDEMVTPHGPGCTLADPCDECRRYAGEGVDPGPYAVGPDTGWPLPDRPRHSRYVRVAAEGADRIASAFGVPGPMIGPDVDPLQPVALVRGWLPARTEVGPMDQGALITPWRTVLGPDEPIRVTLPGVYELDATEYHDPDVTGDWLSNSDARQLIDDGCPAQFRYDRDNGVRKTSEAFSVGHAVHAAILGKGEAIAVRPLVNPDNPDEVWDSWRKHSAQRWKAEQEAAGRSVILPEQAEFVEAMASAVHLKPRAHELLSQPGRPEVALFWVDPVTGVKRRCLVDYLPDGPGPDGVMRPVDIKSADEVAPNDSMEKKLYDHCWHRQAVTIADGIRVLGLADEVHFHFIVQSKKAPHLVTVVDLDADAERIGGIENMRAMLVYKECMETGVWPDYAPDTVTLTVPQWISRFYEEDIEVG